MKKVVFGFMLLTLLPAIGLASGNGIYGVSKVGCTTTDGTCWISLTTSISTSINNCVSGTEARFLLSDPGSSGVLSLALAAHAAGKKLEIYTLDGASFIRSYPKALHVSIVQ